MPEGLTAQIAQAISARGPLPLARYMALCNAHYYGTRDPLGQAGDFTTAPEISQLFGELLGLWAVAEWERLGCPASFALLELGPGRGTLLADALRAARVRPAFLQAMRLQLLEVSPTRRQTQAARLEAYAPTWHDTLDVLPPLPLIVIANEFFDALPVQQLIRSKHGWLERCVTLDTDKFAWCEQPVAATTVPADLQTVPLDTIIEYCPDARAILAQLSARIAAHGGSMALVDYGDCLRPAALTSGDTLQALRRHAKAEPLQNPGDCDLTCHVDFTPLLAVARAHGLQTAFGTQGDFLRMLGIDARAAQLAALHPAQAATLDAARARLTGTAPGQMGSLFKVAIICA